jgi:hypothetical protein
LNLLRPKGDGNGYSRDEGDDWGDGDGKGDGYVYDIEAGFGDGDNYGNGFGGGAGWGYLYDPNRLDVIHLMYLAVVQPTCIY